MKIGTHSDIITNGKEKNENGTWMLHTYNRTQCRRLSQTHSQNIITRHKYGADIRLNVAIAVCSSAYRTN